MKKVITLTLCNRPEYTRRMFASLSKCVGIKDYLLLPQIEPVSHEVVSVARGVNFAECKYEINQKRLGCATNTFMALKRGFGLSDFVIHVEDDVCLAPDALLYAEFCAKRFRDASDVYTVSLYHRGKCDESQFYKVTKRNWFVPWGWGTWKNRWEEPGGMTSNWDFESKPGDKGWDVNINERLRKGRNEVHPVLARSLNIGAEGGIHTPSAKWHKENVHSDFWAGDASVHQSISSNADRWIKGSVITP